jgi:pilus assembly protein CpaB
LNRNLRIGILVVIVGAAFLLGGIYIVMRLVSSLTPSSQPVAQVIEPLKKTVVITTRDLPLGTLLKAEDLTTLDVAVEVAPRDVMSEPGAVVGLITTSSMTTGEMVLNHRLADPTNVSHDLAYILEENQVLMAFPSSDLLSSLNVVQRGDQVDILVSLQQTVPVVPVADPNDVVVSPTAPDEEETETRTFTFSALQRVNITATVVEVPQGDNAQAAPRVRSYLLAVSPQDALVLKHLRDTGAIFDLVLRSPTSVEQFDLVPVISEYLIDRYQLEITK